MTKITNLFPKEMVLASTLAGRIHQIRNYRNMTLKDLSRATRMPVKRLEEIEGGIETWLSDTERQIMAKALRVESYILQEVEYRSDKEPHPPSKSLNEEEKRELIERIMHGEDLIPCPRCKTPLKCTVQEGYDLDGRKFTFPKAYCPECPFVLK